MISACEPESPLKRGISVELGIRKSKTVEETVEKSAKLILKLIAENPSITAAKLQQITGLSRRGVEYNLEKLKSERRLVREGPTKGGKWKIIPSKK